MIKTIITEIERTTPKGGTKPFPSVVLAGSNASIANPADWPQWTAQQQAAIQAKIGILSAEGKDF